MLVYTVTIGRNYSTGTSVPPSMRGKAMPITLWEQFIEDVTADMAKALLGGTGEIGDVAEVHRGTGIWQGVEEESAKITMLLDLPALDDDLDTLRNYLSENARQYGQDSIALTIGQSELC